MQKWVKLKVSLSNCTFYFDTHDNNKIIYLHTTLKLHLKNFCPTHLTKHV